MKYLVFHSWIHSFSNTHMCRDNADKFEFSRLLANTCLDSDCGLFAFDSLYTHLHYLYGLRWHERFEPPAGWDVIQIKKFNHLLRRRYGAYFRRKYPLHNGPIFALDNDNFTEAGNPDAFTYKMKYVHHNSTNARIFEVYEDNAFCSYPLYLSAFIENPEFQNLPAIQHVSTSPDYLPIYKALDMNFALRQYRAQSHAIRVNKFVKQHVSHLYYKIRSAHYRHEALGLMPFFDSPDLLQISNTRGHKVMRFIDDINGAEDLQNFLSFFPVGNLDPHGAFALIRENFPCEFTEFIVAIGKHMGLKPLSRATGICRGSLRKLITK